MKKRILCFVIALSLVTFLSGVGNAAEQKGAQPFIDKGNGGSGGGSGGSSQ